MKKVVLLVLCMMFTVSWGFSLDKAAGGGLLFNASWTNGEVDSSGLGNYEWTLSRTGFGAFGFFGLGRFLELNLGLMVKTPNELEVRNNGYSEKVTGSKIGLDTATAFQFGAYGKYPFILTDKLVLFPTLGLDLELTLSGSDNFDWWHDFWIRGGLGLDVFLTQRMFLRNHLIYGIAVPMGGSEELGLTIGHGLLIKVGIGWMF